MLAGVCARALLRSNIGGGGAPVNFDQRPLLKSRLRRRRGMVAAIPYYRLLISKVFQQRTYTIRYACFTIIFS